MEEEGRESCMRRGVEVEVEAAPKAEVGSGRCRGGDATGAGSRTRGGARGREAGVGTSTSSRGAGGAGVPAVHPASPQGHPPHGLSGLSQRDPHPDGRFSTDGTIPGPRYRRALIRVAH